MNESIAYIETPENLILNVGSTTYTVPVGHSAYQDILVAIDAGDVAKIRRMLDTSSVINEVTEGNIVVKNGVVFYMGEALHNVIVDKLLALMDAGRSYKHLIRFLERLMANPSKRAVDELYRFLEHKCLPITQNGTFLAYKGVKTNYFDIYTGKFDNSVGKTLEMPRNKVDDNKEVGCSQGFHAGSLEYATQYGASGRLVIVEIDPADVVSIPLDCSCQKLRTCRYKVIADFTRPMSEPVYDNRTGTPLMNDEEDDVQVATSDDESIILDYLRERLVNGDDSSVTVRDVWNALNREYDYDFIMDVVEGAEDFWLSEDFDNKGDSEIYAE